MISKVVRNLKSPFQLVKKLIKSLAFSRRYSSEDMSYWISIKNKYKGRRGFVIGNGPSLRMTDLDLLRDEITIASNKIYLSFRKTEWRPTYFTIADPLVWEKVQFDLRTYFTKVHIPTYLPRKDPEFEVYWRAKYMGVCNRFSNDLSDCAFSGQTVTYENIQLAVHLGLDPIYILGCDHNYSEDSKIIAGVPIAQGTQQTHFTSGYRTPGEIVMPASIVDMEASYREARKYCDKNGIEIYNATRGGQLEVFKRVSFDGIL